MFASDGLTTREQLQETIEGWLRNPQRGALNVVGDLQWVGDSVPQSPRVLTGLRALSRAWSWLKTVGEAFDQNVTTATSNDEEGVVIPGIL